MEIKNLLLLSTVIFIFAGCSAKGPQFNGFKQAEQGKSNIYIYRTSYLGAAITPAIHKTNLVTNSDKIIGEIKPNGYIMTTTNPGKYQFWARTEARNEVNLNVKPNKIYCIKHYISLGFFIGHPQFELVDMKECKKEIKKTRLSLLK